MKEEFEFVVLEDGKKYAILDEIEYKDYIYTYLFEPENVKNFFIRKLKNNTFFGLSNEEEYMKALELIRTKNSKLIEKLGL